MAATLEGRTRLVLADEDAPRRETLRALFEQDSSMVVAGVAGHADGAVRQAVRLRPHLLLIQAQLPGGPAAIRRIVALRPVTNVIAITSSRDRTGIAAALGAGALGFVDRDCTADELLTVVRAVTRAEYWTCPRIASGTGTGPALPHARYGLTYLRLVG